MSNNNNKKSETTLKWERSKLQARKASEAVSSLSHDRLTDSNFSTADGALTILKLCHVLSPEPSSPLLTAILQWASACPAQTHPNLSQLKSKLTALHSRLRPQTSLDIVPQPDTSSPLIFSSSTLERSTKNLGKVTQDKFTPLTSKCVVCTGPSSESRCLKVLNPSLLPLLPPSKSNVKNPSPSPEEPTMDAALMETTCPTLVRQNDLLYLLPPKSKTPSCHKVVAINYTDGGVMLVPRSGKNDNPKFVPLLGLLEATVVRREKVGEVEKCTGFVVPAPERAEAYKKLKAFKDEDEWKRNLDGTTKAVDEEEVKRGRKDGERSYHSEKTAMANARDLLKKMDVSLIMHDKAKWLTIGGALKAVSDELLEDWCKWCGKSQLVDYGRKNCLRAWAQFRPRTSWDEEECKIARVNEVKAKAELDEILGDADAGEFVIHKAKQDYARSKTESVSKAQFARVVFKNLKKKQQDEEETAQIEEEDLMVPSVKTLDSSPSDIQGDTIKTNSMVVAEVRVGDYVMLKKNNQNMSKMLGVGQNVDSVILLKTRAEKQFVGKSMHEKVVKGKKEEEKRNVWNKVLECDPLKRLVKISVVPTPLKKETERWCNLGIFSNAWIWRAEENGVGGTIWRLPGGDMNWGIANLNKILDEVKEEKKEAWRVQHPDSDSDDAEEVEEDMNFGAEGMAKEVGETKAKPLKAALKMGLIKALPHSVTICWVPSGAKVHVHLTNKNGSDWRKVYSGKHGGCQVSKLKDGTGYRFKVECEGRRPSFGIYSTCPLPPVKPVGLEWVGGEASRGLKLRVGDSKSKFVVRIETSSYHAKSGKMEKWENKGETKDETFIVKGTKVGTGVKVRTRFLMPDGTVGVQTEELDLGVVPRRGGLIVLDYDGDDDMKKKDEVDAKTNPKPANQPLVQAQDTQVAKLVSKDLNASHPIINFASFFSELQEILPPGLTTPASTADENSEPSNLPPGWSKVFNAEYNKSYYWNEDKQRSQWTEPE